MVTYAGMVAALEEAYGINALTPEARTAIANLSDTVTGQIKLDYIDEWLDKPIPLLDGRSVLDVARSGDIEALVTVRDYMEVMFT